MAGSPLHLSVLDQTPIAEGSTGSQALRNTIDLAQLADGLGYTRYWVAEHHGGALLAGPSPEALIGPIAAATEHLRVGSGGVMLPHYSALKVAESFSVLSGLFPERIDLAVGRAPGTDQLTAHALQRDRTRAPSDDFEEQLVELLAYLERRFPEGHPLARLAETMPGRPESPEPWLLGSSPQSALWAAELGLPYAFADFINADGSHIAESYRRRFVDSERLAAPRVAIAVRALVAATSDEARHLATSYRMAFTMLRRGRPIAVPPPEKAQRFLAAEGAVERPGSRHLVGTGAEVRAGIEEAAAAYQADEVIVVTITHDHAARRRSYELLADAFALEPPTAAGRRAATLVS